jgi:hypothetical protein
MGFNKRARRASGSRPSTPNRNGQQRELGRDVAQAEKLVAIWNSRAARKARLSFYPTIETALLAGTPWLGLLVPGLPRHR